MILQLFKSRIEELREAIRRNRQRKPIPSPLLSSGSRKKAKVRRKSEEKATSANHETSKTALLVTTGGDNETSTPV